MKKHVKIIAISLAGIVAVAGIAWYAMAPLAVELVELTPQTALIQFTEEGVFIYDNEYEVYPLVSGQVLEVRVKEGQQVKAGDVIAVVNATDYEYQVAQLESSIKGYEGQIYSLSQQEQAERDALRVQLGSLEGQLASLDAQLENRDITDDILDRQIDLQLEVIRQDRRYVDWAEEAVKLLRDEEMQDTPEYYAAQQVLAQARKAQAASEAQLEALRSGGLAGATLDGQRQSIKAQIDEINARMKKSYTGGMAQYYQSLIESAKASILQLQEQMGRAEITAPQDGRIVRLPVSSANVVGAQQAVAVIASLEVVEVYIPVREIDGVAVGDKVELILDKRLGEQTLAGTVTFLEERAEVKLSALGVEERKIKTLIRPEESGLGIGFAVDARFTVLSRPDCLIVPKTAVFQQDDGSDCVWVLGSGDKTEPRPVTRDVETRDGYVITDGLSAGDRVVRDANNSALSPGKKLSAII